MRILNTLLALIVASVVSASAQGLHPDTYRAYPYVFIGAQGGVQTTFTNYKQTDLITPIGAVQVGAMFSPVVGARLHVGGINNKSGFQHPLQNGNHDLGTYDYKYVTSNFDVMLNLVNIFVPSKAPRLVNPYLVGGVGLAYAWDYDNLAGDPAHGVGSPLRWTGNRLTHNFRVGAMVEFNVCKWLGINIEVDANNYHDRYNSKYNSRGDWQLTAMAGLNFKFGFRKVKNLAPVAATTISDYNESDNTSTIVATPVVVEKETVPETAEVQVEPARTHADIFFKLGKSTITSTEEVKIAQLATWMKEHPTAKVSLVGYADAGTGNKRINRKLAAQRVERVKDLLVNKYGANAKQLNTDSKGDTIQPFENNDDNRVVICDGEEK